MEFLLHFYMLAIAALDLNLFESIVETVVLLLELMACQNIFDSLKPYAMAYYLCSTSWRLLKGYYHMLQCVELLSFIFLLFAFESMWIFILLNFCGYKLFLNEYLLWNIWYLTFVVKLRIVTFCSRAVLAFYGNFCSSQTRLCSAVLAFMDNTWFQVDLGGPFCLSTNCRIPHMTRPCCLFVWIIW